MRGMNPSYWCAHAGPCIASCFSTPWQSTTFFLSERWQNFTRCERIRNIIRESFDVWSAANPTLHFVDVTDRCESERLWVPIDDDKCAESQHCIDLESAPSQRDLVGKRVVVVANLKPRKIFGHESQGMVLAASDDAHGLSVLGMEKDIDPGTKVS